jgi:hypothetical protein
MYVEHRTQIAKRNRSVKRDQVDEKKPLRRFYAEVSIFASNVLAMDIESTPHAEPPAAWRRCGMPPFN